MNWSIRIVLFTSVVFSTQIMFSMEQAATPWESMQMAERFIASFLTAIARSSAFTSSQQDDMSTIRKTLTAAMERFNSSNTSFKTKSQTLNMVFASAMAGITAESGGESIELKTNAIENALNSACLEAIGMTNPQFVSDVKNLIYTLAHTTASKVSTASVVKKGDNKPEPVGQQGPSTSAKVTEMNVSAPQKGPGTEQQGSSTLRSSITPNIGGGYRSALKSVTRPQGPAIQIPFEQQAETSAAALSIKRNSQGPPSSEAQGSSPQVPSVQDQQGRDRYGTAQAISAATGGESGTLGHKSNLNRPLELGPDDFKQTGRETSKQGKFGAVGKGSGGDGPAIPATSTSGTYGVAIKQEGSSSLREKRPGTQEPSKARDQRPGSYGMKEVDSVIVSENEPGRDAKKSSGQGSLGSREQEKLFRGVAVNQRPENYKPGNYGWGPFTSLAEDVARFRPVNSTGRSQKSQGPIAQNAEGSSNSGSKAAATAVAGSNAPGTGTGRYRLEDQDVHGSSRLGSQDEREIREKIPSEQRLGNQGRYRKRYQETSNLGSQIPRDYPKGAASSPLIAKYGLDSSGGVRGGQAPSGQRLGTLRNAEAEDQSITYGSNEYGRGRVDSVATISDGYESKTGGKRLYGFEKQALKSSGPASEVHKSYVSGRDTGIMTTAGGYDPVGPTIASRIAAPYRSSQASSAVLSSVSKSPIKPSALSNTFSSIVSQVGISNSCLSTCDVLVKILLDIVSELVHLLGTCNTGQFNHHDASIQYASMSDQSAERDI